MRRIAILLIMLGFSISAFAENTKNVIRVAVLKDAKELVLGIKGNYEIYSLKNEVFLSKGKNLWSAHIKPTDHGFKMDDVNFKIYGIKVISKNGGVIKVNNKEFRGNIDIIRTKDVSLLVVNHVDLEDYIKGVLYNEVSHKWPLEVLKAQAIVSRTFALYQKYYSKNPDYDLTDDIYSQVYGGKNSEKYLTNKAVDLTKGEVLVYNKKLIPAYFHATCGGKTEDASNLWKTNLPPLKGTVCTYCKESPHFNWKTEMNLEEIRNKLSRNYVDMDSIKSIEIKSKNSTGRIDILIIKTDNGELLIPAKDFRILMGPNIIRSTNFEVAINNGTAEFSGTGWGHGVGMCQWGAYGLATLGVKAEEILKFYYPKTKIFKMK